MGNNNEDDEYYGDVDMNEFVCGKNFKNLMCGLYQIM